MPGVNAGKLVDEGAAVKDMGYGLGHIHGLIGFAIQTVRNLCSRVLVAFNRLLDALSSNRPKCLPSCNAYALVVIQNVLHCVPPCGPASCVPVALRSGH